MMLAILFGAAALAAAPPPVQPPADAPTWVLVQPPIGGYGPGADPYPGSTAPVTYVAYDYWLPAINKKTGKRVPGYVFKCHCDVRGRHSCKLIRKG